MDPLGPDGDDDGPSRRYADFIADGERLVIYDTTNHDAWVESTVSVAVRQ